MSPAASALDETFSKPKAGGEPRRILVFLVGFRGFIWFYGVFVCGSFKVSE